jgi:hypothetical protein
VVQSNDAIESYLAVDGRDGLCGRVDGADRRVALHLKERNV